MKTYLSWSHGPPLRLIQRGGPEPIERGVVRKEAGKETFVAYIHTESTTVGIGRSTAVKGFPTQMAAQDFLMATCSILGDE